MAHEIEISLTIEFVLLLVITAILFNDGPSS